MSLKVIFILSSTQFTWKYFVNVFLQHHSTYGTICQKLTFPRSLDLGHGVSPNHLNNSGFWFVLLLWEFVMWLWWTLWLFSFTSILRSQWGLSGLPRPPAQGPVSGCHNNPVPLDIVNSGLGQKSQGSGGPIQGEARDSYLMLLGRDFPSSQMLIRKQVAPVTTVLLFCSKEGNQTENKLRMKSNPHTNERYSWENLRE